MEPRCLICCKPLEPAQTDYHPRCCRKMFASAAAPVLPFDENQIEKHAAGMVRRQVSVTGVQPKLSLDLEPDEGGRGVKRFCVARLGGEYLLKPPSRGFPLQPELEDLTMHMARAAGIATVPHCLVRLQSGSLAYLTRRIDRMKTGKRQMEDMCQITGRLTADKCSGSYEEIAAAIRRYSANPGIDVINFFEVVVFSFLTGNSDMHLKNFSMIDDPAKGGFNLAPAYDLLPAVLLMPSYDEELVLALNGKKAGIVFDDFSKAMDGSSIDKVVQQRMFRKFSAVLPAWQDLIERSFLDKSMRVLYSELIMKRYRRLRLDG